MDEADGQPRLWERLRHEHRLLALALLPALPSLVVAAFALGRVPVSPPVRWLVVAVLAICWIGGAWLVRAEVARPLQTLANAIASLREGDYTIRVLGARPE